MSDLMFCYDSTAVLMLNDQQVYLFGRIQTSQTGGQPYSDSSPMISVHCLRLQNYRVVSIEIAV